jgi:predicted transposase YdaD
LADVSPLPASFVDERLADRHADLLFTVQCAGRETFLYVLLEHQSSVDTLMAFRVMAYVVRIWERFLSAHPDARRWQDGVRCASALCCVRR